jgi:hypothetical protein
MISRSPLAALKRRLSASKKVHLSLLPLQRFATTDRITAAIAGSPQTTLLRLAILDGIKKPMILRPYWLGRGFPQRKDLKSSDTVANTSQLIAKTGIPHRTANRFSVPIAPNGFSTARQVRQRRHYRSSSSNRPDFPSRSDARPDRAPLRRFCFPSA